MDNRYNNKGDSYLNFHYRTHPVFGKYRRGPTPFNVRTYFTIIANAPRRPLTETLAVWLEDYSERYPREWIETQQQICIQGGPIFELSHQPLPWIEVYLSRWSGNCWSGNWGGNECIFFQSLVCCHLAKKHLQRLRVWQCQVQHRLDKFLAYTHPRRLVFIHTRISNRSLCYGFRHWGT